MANLNIFGATLGYVAYLSLDLFLRQTMTTYKTYPT